MTTETLKETLTFEVEKETKNTFRYAEVAEVDPPMVGSLYILKECLGTPPPRRLTVTIEAAPEGA